MNGNRNGRNKKETTSEKNPTKRRASSQSNLSKFFKSSTQHKNHKSPSSEPTASDTSITQVTERKRCAYSMYYENPFLIDRHPSVGDANGVDSVRKSAWAFYQQPRNNVNDDDNKEKSEGEFDEVSESESSSKLAKNLDFVLKLSLNYPSVTTILAENELNLIQRYQNLSIQSREIFSQLYYKDNSTWMKVGKYVLNKYSSEDILSSFNILSDCDLLEISSKNDYALLHKNDLKHVVNDILNKREKKVLLNSVMARTFDEENMNEAILQNLKTAYNSCQKKPASVPRCWTLFWNHLGDNLVRIKKSNGDIFHRIHRLVFSTAGYLPEECKMLLKNDLSLLRFPTTYSLSPISPFENRFNFLNFESSLSLVDEFLLYIKKEDIDTILRFHFVSFAFLYQIRIMHDACTEILPLIENRTIGLNFCLTPDYWYLQIIHFGVSQLEKLRRYDEALHYLSIALKYFESSLDDISVTNGSRIENFEWKKKVRNKQSSNMFGSIFCRYVIDHNHLNRKASALEHVNKALKNPVIEGSHRLTLQKICQRLCVPPRCWKKPVFPELLSIPKVTIKHRRNTNSPRVEQVVIDHYANEGWKGWHGENGVMVILYSLFMWNVNFSIDKGNDHEEVDLGFYLPIQDSSHFFGCINHLSKDISKKVKERLDEIESWSYDDIVHYIKETYKKYEGVQARGVLWEGYPISDLSELGGCIGGQVLSKVFEKMSSNYQAFTCGFPDCWLWSKDKKKAILAEVKGPGDSLSERQNMTLDYCLRAGSEVIVVHVVYT